MSSNYLPPEDASEKLRCQGLKSLAMLDSSLEEPFKRITKAMSDLFKTPMSLITLAADRSCGLFKSCVGPFGPFGSCGGRDCSWCNCILLPETPEILITEDASTDARFSNDPFVAGEPFIKFYAGAPLIGAHGERYGTLCIIDLLRRVFTAELYSLLINFAALAVEEIERNNSLRDKVSTAKTNNVENNRYLDISLIAATSGIAMLDLHFENWPIRYINPSFEKSAGVQTDNSCCMDFWEVFENSDQAEMHASILKGAVFDKHLICKRSGSSILLRFMPANSDRLAPSKATGIPCWVPSEKDSADCKLGLDVDSTLVSSGDMDSVPHSKFFWFAIVLQDSEHIKADMNIGSPQADTTLDANRGSSSWSDGHNSGFGDYSLPPQLANLKIGPLLGTGSFGKVYRGWDSNHAVAIKVIDRRGRPGNKLAISDETEFSLEHPRVVRILSHGLSTEVRRGEPLQVAWIVQELCDMGTLTDAGGRGWRRVCRSMTAPPDMAVILPTMQDIADAMAYVHKQNVIHADLTGRNVLLTSSSSDPRGFVAKVCDFGMSRWCETGKEIETRSVGTVTHMPPELLADGILSPAADVWAFGVLAWEAYHGKCAFKGKSTTQIIIAVASDQPLPWPSDAPAGFAALMARCMSFEAPQRAIFDDVVVALGASGGC